MSCQSRVMNVNACVQHRDLDWPIRTASFIYLVSLRQVNLVRRPLRDVGAKVAADAPGVSHAPGIAAAFGWLFDEVWFGKKNARIRDEGGNTCFDRRRVEYAQT